MQGLTHWGRDKMAAIFQTTFSNTFSLMKMYEFRLKFHWSMFTKGPINNIPALVQIMAWRRSGDKPSSEPMMVSLPTHICVTRPQWVNHNAYNSAYFITRNSPVSPHKNTWHFAKRIELHHPHKGTQFMLQTQNITHSWPVLYEQKAA